MIKVNNLTVYSLRNNIKTYLLKDVTFSLDKGDSLGIIGKSGEGKSTLAKALLQIYDNNVYFECGTIKINNNFFTADLRGNKISMLFQNPNSYLNPLMKVGKQIDEMLRYHFKDNKKVAKEKTINFMKKLGLIDADKIYNYYPYEISGGMQQKICLCIALICNPDILILDESTSYLDIHSKNEILTLIKSLQKEYHFTLIMISHDLKEIYYMCDKIAIMQKGQLVELGNKKEIILNPAHPYTIELLYDYARFYKDIENFACPFTNMELIDSPPITMLSETHFVRSWFLNKNNKEIIIPNNFNKIKEDIYESLRNK